KPPLDPARARAALESAVAELNRAHSANGRLPWLGVLLAWLALGGGAARAAEALRTMTVKAPADGTELELRLTASAPGASWEAPGRECAVLRISVDGRYDQHLFLVGGGEERSYAFLVGPLERGEHAVGFEWDRRFGRDLAEPPVLGRVETAAV